MRSFCQPLERRVLFALTATAAELRANTTTFGDQFAPVVASDNVGNSVIVWVNDALGASGRDIFAKRFDANGNAVGAEFAVNTITSGSQSQPAVAMDDSGNFVIAWTSDEEIKARRFNSSGVALDATEFQVNNFTALTQDSPAVAVDADGDFVIAFDSEGVDGSSFGVFARRYNAAGVAQDANEFVVNQVTTDFQGDPSVAMDSAGNFTVAWDAGNLTTGQDGSFYGIFSRRFAANGSALSGEFQVNTFTTDYQIFPSIAMSSAGAFVIAWESYGQDGSQNGIYARRYDSTGTAINANEFRVNAITVNNESDAAVAMDGSGNFMITWQTDGRDGSGGTVFARSYDSAGSAGAESSVNTFTLGDQIRPAIAMSDNGTRAMVVWQSEFQDGSGYGVYAQRFATPDALLPIVTSATFNVVPNQSVAIQFRETVAINLGENDVLLQNLTTSTAIPSVSMSLWYSGGTNPAVITIKNLPGTVLPDGNYRLTLVASGIQDVNGNNLDGDNNGSAGGDYTFDFFVLAGDANRDRTVNNVDLGILANNWQGFPKLFTEGDFNYDGKVDIGDLRILGSHFGQTLAPAPLPAQPIAASVFVSNRRAPVRTITLIG